MDETSLNDNSTTKETTDTTHADTSTDGLLSVLGIDESQINTSTATTSTRTKDTDTPNANALKDKAKKSISTINSTNGKHIRFSCVKTDGYVKDSNGSYVKNEDGKKVRQYKKVTKEGFYVVDKMEKTINGKKMKYFHVSKMVQYTDSDDCTSFKEI